MARSLEFYRVWENFDNAKIQIDGLAHRLRVSVYETRYPRRESVISVHAEPINKNSKKYREIRAQLGDDWSTDVLESDISLQSEILEQLLPRV